jgi:DUF971 family protein
MGEVFPTAFARQSDGLIIQWSDGARLRYRASQLRGACPCATCREKHGKASQPKPAALPVLSLAEARPTTIDGMHPVGNYAYQIQFSDGHDSGLYTFDYLYSLGESGGVTET